MKKLLTLALVITLTNQTLAQQILFKENFNSMTGLGLSGGWKGSSTGGVGWRTSDMYNLYCYYSVIPQYAFWARVAAISGCYGDKGGKRNNQNVFAYTKSINLSSVQGGAMLKYDSYFNKLNAYFKYEKATVEVSINDGASWTVVQNVPAGSGTDSFATWYINLSQYIGYGNVRIGFRYSDQGVDHKYGGWAIDNIELFRPAKNDLALIEFTPTNELSSYTTINNTFVHTGKVLNQSLDTIHNFTINYRRGNSYILSETYNTTLAPLAEFNFSHNIPDTVFQAGKTDITAWVTTAGDANHNNDTVYTAVNGVHFLPKKLVVVEEGTGTWNIFGPRGLVYMNALHYDNEAALVSVHSSDPMGMEGYSDYFYYLNYYSGQFFMVDRKYVEPTELFSTFTRHQQHFGFADLEMHGGVYGEYIDVGVTVKPATDLSGDFRLLLVVTEDDVKGTGPGWDQANGYTGGAMGAMGTYQTKPNPVPLQDVQYNYVARAILPAPDGGKTFANELKYNGDYYHNFRFRMEEHWDKNKMRAIVMLFNYDDTLILNSNRLNYFLNVAGTEKEDALTGIYPNPANEYTMLQFETKAGSSADILVTDINGRKVLHIPIQETKAGKNQLKISTASLPNGLYILNVITEQTKHALKLHVVH